MIRLLIALAIVIGLVTVGQDAGAGAVDKVRQALSTRFSPCHVSKPTGAHANEPGPDNAEKCTPGSARALTRAQACTSKDRPSLPSKARSAILTKYGHPDPNGDGKWTGADGELDHRIPFFLGGNTNEKNIWPEPDGSIPNDKDQLEFYIYDRVCRERTMRPRAARRIFKSDWRHAACFYKTVREKMKHDRCPQDA